MNFKSRNFLLKIAVKFYVPFFLQLDQKGQKYDEISLKYYLKKKFPTQHSKSANLPFRLKEIKIFFSGFLVDAAT